jgi:hypothetical protein
LSGKSNAEPDGVGRGREGRLRENLRRRENAPRTLQDRHLRSEGPDQTALLGKIEQRFGYSLEELAHAPPRPKCELGVAAIWRRLARVRNQCASGTALCRLTGRPTHSFAYASSARRNRFRRRSGSCSRPRTWRWQIVDFASHWAAARRNTPKLGQPEPRTSIAKA